MVRKIKLVDVSSQEAEEAKEPRQGRALSASADEPDIVSHADVDDDTIKEDTI